MYSIDWYYLAKAIHLIGMVSWMAGLFYLVRLMVYHAEAFGRPDSERLVLTRQYVLMEGKVYRVILQPALVITWVFGVLMLILQPHWLQQAWMLVKLSAVVLLTAYTAYCRGHIRRLECESGYFSHVHYRILNEVPTIVLLVVVLLAVFRTRTNWLALGLAVGVFSGLILFAIRKVARLRQQKPGE